jgi:hypothetical protein
MAATPNATAPAPRRRTTSAALRGPRPCELCYRPLATGEERFCRRCGKKAKRLGR